jgi:hypothetical protein
LCPVIESGRSLVEKDGGGNRVPFVFGQLAHAGGVQRASFGDHPVHLHRGNPGKRIAFAGLVPKPGHMLHEA